MKEGGKSQRRRADSLQGPAPILLQIGPPRIRIAVSLGTPSRGVRKMHAQTKEAAISVSVLLHRGLMGPGDIKKGIGHMTILSTSTCDELLGSFHRPKHKAETSLQERGLCITDLPMPLAVQEFITEYVKSLLWPMACC